MNEDERRFDLSAEAVSIMNRRLTISGVDRGTQRAIYDQRRQVAQPGENQSRDHFP